MAMTPQKVYDLLLQRLGARKSGNQIGQHLIAELNAAQLHLESNPPYPFFLEAYAQGLVPSVEFDGFSLPENFITEHEDRPITYTAENGDKTDLEKRPFSELVNGSYSAEGSPLYYAIVGGTDVHVFPYTSEGTYSIRYYANADPVTSETLNITNKWYRFCPFLLMAHAGFNYASATLKDAELSQYYASMILVEQAKLIALNTQIENAKFDASAQALRNY